MKGTLALSWGRYGGFYRHQWRLCLGWVAITYIPAEVDDLMDAYAARLALEDRLAGALEALGLLASICPPHIMERYRERRRAQRAAAARSVRRPS